jgi:crotonobetainyl-CoA:carnitine CoA-transferase CaiB-like acyl-CoA transferase
MVNGRVPPSRGNADAVVAPHGVYPCAPSGGERWCAIVCESDADWRALVMALGAPDWTRDPALATSAGRKACEAELDARLAVFTATQEAGALAARLQRAGVPAGMVQSCADLHTDPQLAARVAFPMVEHPEMGRTPYETWAFRLNPDQAPPRRAPLLGEHTEEVLMDILGMSREEIARLSADGILS